MSVRGLPERECVRQRPVPGKAQCDKGTAT